MTNFLREHFNLTGKTAVITGGGGHLCGEMARGLALSGVNTVVADLRKEKAKAVSEDIVSLGGKSIGIELDAADKDSVINSLNHAINRFEHVDILINGAGINSSTPFFQMELSEWQGVINSQLTSTFLCCQVYGNYMVERRSGSILNISSASAGPPLSKAFPYSVAKAGIVNLTKNLAREWGEKGVRVNALRPGFFPTEWNRKNFITPERETSILTHTPMKRYGDVSELIGACIWLASDASSFVTGAEIPVDGGFSAMTI